MSNEAAERLRELLIDADAGRPLHSQYGHTMAEWLDAALAAERRATVERIRAMVAATVELSAANGQVASLYAAFDILDAVAER
jgi:hypothetical protein